MFDSETERLMRQAPAILDINPETLPQHLTSAYARLTAARLAQSEGERAETLDELSRNGEGYETLARLATSPEHRRAAAFVAATAHQICARFAEAEEQIDRFDRDLIPSSVASVVMFLAAKQFPDAQEATFRIAAAPKGERFTVRRLRNALRRLGRQDFGEIIRRSRPREIDRRNPTHALYDALLEGVELLAAEVLGEALETASGRFESSIEAFKKVKALAGTVRMSRPNLGSVTTLYTGPRHLASLLLTAAGPLKESAVISIPPPEPVDPKRWHSWLRLRARRWPLLWQNHWDAIQKGIHEPGVSAVLVLPTGSGKTALSEIKIATTVTSGRSVAFLVPTNALVDQVREDLALAFPPDWLGGSVSAEAGFFALEVQPELGRIEVMTPESCLAACQTSPEAFSDLGLLVFDECHMLSASAGSLRRALDGMMAVLSVGRLAPDADFLFLTAMLQDATEFAEWIESLTGRECRLHDSFWKPSRQARGLVVYERKAVPYQVSASPDAVPFGLFGLHHAWQREKFTDFTIAPLLDHTVKLGVNKESEYPTPNANFVACELACAAAGSQLKTIIFVNTKVQSVSTAETISKKLAVRLALEESETALWREVCMETGGPAHAIPTEPAAAMPHSALMLPVERRFAEMLFRRRNGSAVIVATPTLAQGMNLPAQLAILAGDKRADGPTRDPLKAHEILNAAARAGRAGYLANGVVLLIPEPVVTFAARRRLTKLAEKKLRSVLPEHDRCMAMVDPLESVLDKVQAGAANSDIDVQYVVNRFGRSDGSDGLTSADLGKRSLGAFFARKQDEEAEFSAKLEVFQNRLEASTSLDDELVDLASETGWSPATLRSLRNKFEISSPQPDAGVADWVDWVLDWICDNPKADADLLLDDQVYKSLAAKKEGLNRVQRLHRLRGGLMAWISGRPLRDMERALGQEPVSGATKTSRRCPRARAVATQFAPRQISYACGVAARMYSVIDSNNDLGIVLEALQPAVKRGFDDPSKLAFALLEGAPRGRVAAHHAFAAALPKGFPFSGFETLLDLRQQISTIVRLG